MTMPIHINALEYARKLTAAGIPAPQADAQAQALYDVLGQSIVVVPDDLAWLRTDILARIDVVKGELHARIDAVEQSLNARIGALEQSVRARYNTLNWMMSASLAMHAIVLYKLFAPQADRAQTSSGAVVARTKAGETSRPSSNSRHIGIASENMLTASGGVTMAATANAPTMA